MKPKITQAVKSAVNAYFLARINAEVHRERVDAIQRRLLNETGYYVSKDHGRYADAHERITEPKNTWLMSDDDSHDYLSDLRDELEKAGYKIDAPLGEPYWSYFCPALTAESLQRDTEHLLIDSAAEMLGEKDDFRHKLLCAGLEKYHKFVDLVCKLVVNSPGFKNPLTGQSI